jgi:hypothetical protein
MLSLFLTVALATPATAGAPFTPVGLPQQLRPDSALVEHERFMASLPDPGAAAVLSGTVGFGAGHFYAKQPQAGFGHLTAQALGLMATAAGFGVDSSQAARGLWAGGGALFLAGRIMDVVTAPQSAHRTADEQLAARRR